MKNWRLSFFTQNKIIKATRDNTSADEFLHDGALKSENDFARKSSLKTQREACASQMVQIRIKLDNPIKEQFGNTVLLP